MSDEPNISNGKLFGLAMLSTVGASVPVALESMCGQPTGGLAIAGTSALTGTLGFLSGAISNFVYGKVSENYERHHANRDDLLINGDWLKVTALAVKRILVEDAARDEELADVAETLLVFGDFIEKEWHELADTPSFAEQMAPINRHESIKYFHAAAKTDETQRRALDPETWQVLLGVVAIKYGCHPDGEKPPNVDFKTWEQPRLRKIAELMTAKHAQAVYRLLKHPEKGHRACTGLMLTMLGEIHEGVCVELPKQFGNLQNDIEDASEETRDEIGQLGRRLEKRFDELSQQLPQDERLKFAQHFHEMEGHWQVAYEQFIAHYRKLEKIDEGMQAGFERLETLLARTQAQIPVKSVKRVPPTIGVMFVDRANRSERIRDAFLRRGTESPGTQPIALTANGGYGKTRAAIEFAHEVEDRFRIQLFLDSRNIDSIDQSLVRESVILGAAHPTVHEVCARLSSLATEFGVLVVFDGVDDPEAAKYVKKLMSELSGVQVIATTRITGWGNSVREIPIACLPPQESRKLLMRSSGRQEIEKDDPEVEAVDTIAAELGHLPLALEIGGSYVRNQAIGFGEYLVRLRRHPHETISWHDSLDVDYPKSLVTAFELSWKAIEGQSDQSQVSLVLMLCAGLGNAPVPVEMLGPKRISASRVVGSLKRAYPDLDLDVESMPTLMSVATGYDRDRSVDTLIRYSQITWIGNDKEYVAMHPVVRLALRAKFNVPNDERDVFLALGLVRPHFERMACMNLSRPEAWPIWEIVCPHLLSLASDAEQVRIAYPTTEFLRLIGEFYHASGHYTEAITALNHASDIFSKADHDDTPWAVGHHFAWELPQGPAAHPPSLYALTLCSLARLALDIGRHNDVERLISVLTKLGNDHDLSDNARLEIAKVIASVMVQHERFTEACDVLNSASKLRQEQDADSEYDRLLAETLAFTGHSDRAGRLARQTLRSELTAVRTSPVLNPMDNPYLMQGVNRLGQLFNRGLPTTAGSSKPIPSVMFAPRTRRMTVSVARTLHTLAIIRQVQDKKVQATKLLWRAFAIVWNNYGPFHPETHRLWVDLRIQSGPWITIPESTDSFENEDYPLFVLAMLKLHRDGRLAALYGHNSE